MQLRSIETVNLVQAYLESDPFVTRQIDANLRFFESVPDVLFKSEVSSKLSQMLEMALFESLDKFLYLTPAMRNNLSDTMNAYANFMHKKLAEYEPLKEADDEWERHPNQDEIYV